MKSRTFDSVEEALRFQAVACTILGSPFNGALCDLLAADVEAGGPSADLLGGRSTVQFDALPLRVLGGLHWLALGGESPDLAAHYPSTGGDGDVAAVWPAVRRALSHPDVVAALDRPPQTNEVGRAVALHAGLAEIVEGNAQPLHLREIGSSAGLNLRLDSFGYGTPTGRVGDEHSPLQFPDVFVEGAPSFDVPIEIASRRGCDQDPIDPTEEAGARWLTAYVWPDQEERIAKLRAGIEVARRVPAVVDRAGAAEWLAEQLAGRPAVGTAVVMHSIVWQYLDDPTRTRILATLVDVGDRATATRSLAHLRYEPNDTYTSAELRLTTWPGGEDRLLAEGAFHLGPLTWRV